jgi:hypothetical protein
MASDRPARRGFVPLQRDLRQDLPESRLRITVYATIPFNRRMSRIWTFSSESGERHIRSLVGKTFVLMLEGLEDLEAPGNRAPSNQHNDMGYERAFSKSILKLSVSI